MQHFMEPVSIRSAFLYRYDDLALIIYRAKMGSRLVQKSLWINRSRVSTSIRAALAELNEGEFLVYAGYFGRNGPYGLFIYAPES